ncbi:MAG: redoxin domain-containing protein [Calditrichaeota bacterium]|nr:redoxin domain-containing protein [Calditrichota bacterium]
MKRAILLFMAFIFAQNIPAEVVVKGRVVSALNQPFKKAIVEVVNRDAPEPKPIVHLTLSETGQFQVKLPAHGGYIITFAAVDHQSRIIPLLLEESPTPIELNVTLYPYDYLEDPAEVRIIGSWNKYRFESAKPMTRQGNRWIYQLTAPADTIGYQLLGLLEEERSINGHQADAFEYDGGGDFHSLLYTKKGETVTITVDPGKFPRYRGERDPWLQVDPNHQYIVEMSQITQLYDKVRSDYFQKKKAYLETRDEDSPPFTYDMRPFIKQIWEIASASSFEWTKSLAALYTIGAFAMSGSGDKALLEKSVRLLSPESPIWIFNYGVLFELDRLAREVDLPIDLGAFETQNPFKLVRGTAILVQMLDAKKKGDAATFQRYYQKLATNYRQYPIFEYYIAKYNPDRRIQVGKLVPEFRVTSLDGKTVISSEQLRGKYYLMDFWAVWCGPCIAEMPYLHQAYEKFKDRNFIILSLSFDKSPEVVNQFRQKKWKMPWLHAFVEGGFNSELARTFEVRGIPKPLLVGPDGTILATELELRGEQLIPTLEKLLK